MAKTKDKMKTVKRSTPVRGIENAVRGNLDPVRIMEYFVKPNFIEIQELLRSIEDDELKTDIAKLFNNHTAKFGDTLFAGEKYDDLDILFINVEDKHKEALTDFFFDLEIVCEEPENE